MSEGYLEKAGKIFLNVAFPFLGSYLGVKPQSALRSIDKPGQDIREEFRYKLNRNATLATGMSTLTGLLFMSLSALGEFSTSSEMAKIFSLDDFQGILTHLTHVPYLDGFILTEYLIFVVLLAMLMRGLAFFLTVYLEVNDAAAKDNTEEINPSNEAQVDTNLKAVSPKDDAIVKAKAAWPFYGVLGDTVGFFLGSSKKQGNSATETQTSTVKKVGSRSSGNPGMFTSAVQAEQSVTDFPDANSRPPTALSDHEDLRQYASRIIVDPSLLF